MWFITTVCPLRGGGIGPISNNRSAEGTGPEATPGIKILLTTLSAGRWRLDPREPQAAKGSRCSQIPVGGSSPLDSRRPRT